jgi:hypothetical protein
VRARFKMSLTDTGFSLSRTLVNANLSGQYLLSTELLLLKVFIYIVLYVFFVVGFMLVSLLSNAKPLAFLPFSFFYISLLAVFFLGFPPSILFFIKLFFLTKVLYSVSFASAILLLGFTLAVWFIAVRVILVIVSSHPTKIAGTAKDYDAISVLSLVSARPKGDYALYKT